MLKRFVVLFLGVLIHGFYVILLVELSYFICFQFTVITLNGNIPLLNNIGVEIYNPGLNILRLFDVLPNFLFTTSETMRDY